MPVVQYIIKRGIDDKIDYNMDGVIDEHDDIVVKLVDGIEVSRRPLNERVKQRIENALERGDGSDMQRIVYERAPMHVANPPPLIIKNDTGFGQHFKAGAGEMAGRVAVMGAVGLIASLFSDGGGEKRGRKKKK